MNDCVYISAIQLMKVEKTERDSKCVISSLGRETIQAWMFYKDVLPLVKNRLPLLYY